MISHRPTRHRPTSQRPTRHLQASLPATGAFAVAALIAAALAPAAAQTSAPPMSAPQPPAAGGIVQASPDAAGNVTPLAPRYAFAPVEGGALKLDTQTGKVSLCAKGSSGFTCEAVPDSRDAYEAEIARLQREIAALKGAPAPNAGTGTAPGGTTELDQALDYAERVYRRLRGMIDELRNSAPPEPPNGRSGTL